MAKKEWPKYEMFVSGRRQFLCLAKAAVAYDNGHGQANFGDLVMESASGNTRPMTDADQAAICSAADEFSANK